MHARSSFLPSTWQLVCRFPWHGPACFFFPVDPPGLRRADRLHVHVSSPSTFGSRRCGARMARVCEADALVLFVRNEGQEGRDGGRIRFEGRSREDGIRWGSNGDVGDLLMATIRNRSERTVEVIRRGSNGRREGPSTDRAPRVSEFGERTGSNASVGTDLRSQGGQDGSMEAQGRKVRRTWSHIHDLPNPRPPILACTAAPKRNTGIGRTWCWSEADEPILVERSLPRASVVDVHTVPPRCIGRKSFRRPFVLERPLPWDRLRLPPSSSRTVAASVRFPGRRSAARPCFLHTRLHDVRISWTVFLGRIEAHSWDGRGRLGEGGKRTGRPDLGRPTARSGPPTLRNAMRVVGVPSSSATGSVEKGEP